MANLIKILLVGINIAPFIFYKLDIWHAQGFWVQSFIAILFSYSFFCQPKEVIVRNRSLGALHFWVAAQVGYMCFLSQIEGRYNVQNFFPYFNFLCLLIFYQICVSHLNRKNILSIIVWMKWAIIATLFMCVLQFFGLSQFFALLNTDNHHYNNLVVGFLGNGTHLSGFLASAIPLFLINPKRSDYFSILFILVVLCFTGTTKFDPSVSGFVIAYVLIMIYIFRDRRFKFWVILGATSLFMFITFYVSRETITFSGEPHNLISRMISNHGRFEIWTYYWEIFKNHMPVTGVGLGKINQLYQLTAFPYARHFHLELFQFAFELGIIGFLLIVCVLFNFFVRICEDKLEFGLMLYVLGFCISSCFNYPAHLWMPSTWAIFAYSAFFALKNEGDIYV